MSRHHYTHSEEANSIFHDIQHLAREELELLYGIRIDKDGTVFDPVSEHTFGSLTEWANEEAREEEWTESEHGFEQGRKYHDDF